MKIAHVAHGAEGGLKKDGKMSQQETNVFILFFFLLGEQAKAYREDEEEEDLIKRKNVWYKWHKWNWSTIMMGEVPKCQFKSIQ